MLASAVYAPARKVVRKPGAVLVAATDTNNKVVFVARFKSVHRVCLALVSLCAHSADH